MRDILNLINEIENKHEYIRIYLTRESKSIYHLKGWISRVAIDEFFFSEKFWNFEALEKYLIDLLSMDDLYQFQLDKEIKLRTSSINSYRSLLQSAEQELESLKLRKENT